MSDHTPRSSFLESRRIVLKLGTRVLSRPDGGVALARLKDLLGTVARHAMTGTDFLIVTSGSVGLGAHSIGIPQPIRGIGDRQACAAVGQTQLMGIYERELGAHGLRVGQVLLTHGDFDDRSRYLNVRNTLLTLLRHRVMPIINENDAVSIDELQDLGPGETVFGDNDRLSALVASKLGADLLILLTDVNGLYERDPNDDPSAQLIARIEPGGDSKYDATDSNSHQGRGGMRSKIEAARIASKAGCHAVIASGTRDGNLERILSGESEGTWVVAQQGLSARRRWIAWGSPAKGVLYLDTGAVAALRDRGASLLAAGVHDVRGSFVRGEVVELRSLDEESIGRGMISCDARAARSWVSGQPPKEVRNHHALVHRDHLVLELDP